MTKGYMSEKAHAMDLFWVTARQVIWRTQPHNSTSCQQETKETEAKKNDHPRR